MQPAKNATSRTISTSKVFLQAKCRQDTQVSCWAVRLSYLQKWGKNRNLFTTWNSIIHHLRTFPARIREGTHWVKKEKDCTSDYTLASSCPISLTMYFRAKQSIWIDQTAEPSPKEKQWTFTCHIPSYRYFKSRVYQQTANCVVMSDPALQKKTHRKSDLLRPFPTLILRLCRKDAAEK